MNAGGILWSDLKWLCIKAQRCPKADVVVIIRGKGRSKTSKKRLT